MKCAVYLTTVAWLVHKNHKATHNTEASEGDKSAKKSRNNVPEQMSVRPLYCVCNL